MAGFGIVTIESGLPINVSGGSNNIVGGGNRPDLNGSITYMHSVVPTATPTRSSSTSTRPCFRILEQAIGAILATTPCADRAVTTGTFLSSRPLPSERRAGCSCGWRPSTPSTTPSSRVLITTAVRIRFGQFTSAYPARIIQLGAKVYF